MAKDRHFIFFYLREEAQHIMKKDHRSASIRNLLPKMFAVVKSISNFAVSQFYYHIRIGDFLCPILKYCLKYKQRFLRTYSPQSRYGTVTSWRNSLLSLFINF